jgi:serralysin
MNLKTFLRRSGLARYIAIGAATVLFTTPSQGAFHFWAIREIYSNASGTLQFIELFDQSGGQNFVGGTQIQVSNVGNTQMNTFTLPGGSLPGSTLNRALLFGTTGLQAAGGPTPDYIIPNNFLFSAGGSISFFGSNGGAYTALPTDGFLSRTWGEGNALNSPQNYAGQTGIVPEPGTLSLFGLAGMVLWVSRLTLRRSA